MADVGGVPDLAHLAVADEIDTRLHLVADPVGDRSLDDAIVGISVDLLASVLGQDEVHDVLRPRQAADVGGEDPPRFNRHRGSGCNWWRTRSNWWSSLPQVLPPSVVPGTDLEMVALPAGSA